jgi:hypothetical protein
LTKLLVWLASIINLITIQIYIMLSINNQFDLYDDWLYGEKKHLTGKFSKVIMIILSNRIKLGETM